MTPLDAAGTESTDVDVEVTDAIRAAATVTEADPDPDAVATVEICDFPIASTPLVVSHRDLFLGTSMPALEEGGICPLELDCS